MKILCFVLISLCFITPIGTLADSSVSDSLVENLSCNSLKKEDVLRKIRVEAFSSFYHMPVINWGYSLGLYDLASCWSLARSQRLFFYLSRWNDSSAPDSEKTLFDVLEMIRGSSPYAHPGDLEIKEFPLKELLVFSHSESSLGIQTPLWHSLTKGLIQTFPNDKKLLRNLKSEVEFYQTWRFHDFIKNIRYVIGNGTRTPQQNRATRDLVLRNIEENKLTMLLLRPKRVSQHVVLAKKYNFKSNGDIEIDVYDSNSPFRDQKITFSRSDDEFYAPEIVRGLPHVDDPQAPLGVFVVDEKERDDIERALLKHYKKKCQRTSEAQD